VLSPLLLPPRACQQPPLYSCYLPLLRGLYEFSKNGRGHFTTSGGQQHYTICLTARSSAAGSAPPLLLSVTIHLLDLYHKCVDNSGWVRVLYMTHGSIVKLPLTYNFH
jgi:hypothetical protein